MTHISICGDESEGDSEDESAAESAVESTTGSEQHEHDDSSMRLARITVRSSPDSGKYVVPPKGRWKEGKSQLHVYTHKHISVFAAAAALDREDAYDEDGTFTRTPQSAGRKKNLMPRNACNICYVAFYMESASIRRRDNGVGCRACLDQTIAGRIKICDHPVTRKEQKEHDMKFIRKEVA